MQCEHLQHEHLGHERLRARHRHLRAGLQVDDRIGLAGDRAADDVRHDDHGRSTLLGEPQRSERVGRLTRLADADDERAVVDRRGAVSHLRANLHGGRQPDPVLDQVGRNVRRVAGGAAADHVDALDPRQPVVDGVQLRQRHDALRVDAAAQGLLDRVRLLVDLLEREVREAALLGGLDVPVDLRHLAPLLGAVERQDPRAVGRDVGDVALVEDHDVLRVLEDGRHVAGEEALARRRGRR